MLVLCFRCIHVTTEQDSLEGEDDSTETKEATQPDVIEGPAAQPAVECIKAEDKIAQIAPTQVLTSLVTEVDTLDRSARGTNGFGSTGT